MQAEVTLTVQVADGEPTCEDHTTQAECEAAGCYWYDDSCHGTAQEVCANNPALQMIYGFASAAKRALVADRIRLLCEQIDKFKTT